MCLKSPEMERRSGFHTQHVFAQGELVSQYRLVYSSSEASTGTLLTMLESLIEAILAESFDQHKQAGYVMYASVRWYTTKMSSIEMTSSGSLSDVPCILLLQNIHKQDS